MFAQPLIDPKTCYEFQLFVIFSHAPLLFFLSDLCDKPSGHVFFLKEKHVGMLCMLELTGAASKIQMFFFYYLSYRTYILYRNSGEMDISLKSWLSHVSLLGALFTFPCELYPVSLLLALGDDQLTNYCLLLCLLLLSWTCFFRYEENIRVIQSSSLILVLTVLMQKHVTGDSIKLFALVAAFQHASCVICMLVHVGWMCLL